MPKRIKKRTTSKSRTSTRTKKPRPAPLVSTPAHDPIPDDGLTPLERLFVLEMLIDENQTQAYRRSHPDCHSDGSAAVMGHKLLRKANVRAAYQKERAATYKRLQMSADEALANISRNARADLGEQFDEDGKRLPFRQWPDSLRKAVKAYKVKADGSLEVQLNDPQRANELMAQAGGKLKNVVTLEFDHVAYLGRVAPQIEKDGEA